MRDLVIFIVLLVVIFFGVGEWRGWYFGNPPQTAMFLYKKDYVHEQEWEIRSIDNLPFEFKGKVGRGTVDVQVYYERRKSLQDNNAPIIPKRQIFQQEYRVGETIALDEVFRQGIGQYSVLITFSDASGTFNMEVPSANDRIGGG
jgi:hypothetical protein